MMDDSAFYEHLEWIHWTPSRLDTTLFPPDTEHNFFICLMNGSRLKSHVASFNQQPSINFNKFASTKYTYILRLTETESVEQTKRLLTCFA